MIEDRKDRESIVCACIRYSRLCAYYITLISILSNFIKNKSRHVEMAFNAMQQEMNISKNINLTFFAFLYPISQLEVVATSKSASRRLKKEPTSKQQRVIIPMCIIILRLIINYNYNVIYKKVNILIFCLFLAFLLLSRNYK